MLHRACVYRESFAFSCFVFSDDEDIVVNSVDYVDEEHNMDSESDSMDVEQLFTTTRSGRLATTHYRSLFE